MKKKNDLQYSQILEKLLEERLSIASITNYEEQELFITDYYQKIENLFEALDHSSKDTQVEFLNESRNLALETQDKEIRSSIQELRKHGRTDRLLKTLSIKALRFCQYTSEFIENRKRLIEFHTLKKKADCNCELKQELNLKIVDKPNQYLRFIQVSDAYHDCDLYQCKLCNTYWIWDKYTDDGGVQGWRKPRDKDELEQIAKIEEKEES